jgi:hypothetical protein
MDMQKYLDDFQTAMTSEKEEIYREQIKNYTEFVGGLITTNKILSRRFYVILSYVGSAKAEFDTVQEQLTLNADIVSKGLGRLGIQTRQLKDLEVLDLFYSFYNPGLAKRQPLTSQTLDVLKQAYL